jgi:two-component system alkaline phosphatase synthesis response regulator PhoP
MTQSDFLILLVDDEEDILDFVGYNLRKEGFKVITAMNGDDAIKLTRIHSPHLILLDVMMPGLDGIETCSEIREMKGMENTMIAFLTARNEDYSQIAAFKAGGDDYIVKPIKPKILIKRVFALLRRHSSELIKSNIVLLGDLKIDKEKHQVKYKDRKIDLSKKEFLLLLFLTSKPNKVFTREEIYTNIWDENVLVGERTIDVYIRKLREKIDNDKIKTIIGVGYKYEL